MILQTVGKLVLRYVIQARKETRQKIQHQVLGKKKKTSHDSIQEELSHMIYNMTYNISYNISQYTTIKAHCFYCSTVQMQS